jgi:hypothetical protein
MVRIKLWRGGNFTPKAAKWTLGLKRLLVQARRMRHVRAHLVLGAYVSAPQPMSPRESRAIMRDTWT